MSYRLICNCGHSLSDVAIPSSDLYLLLSWEAIQQEVSNLEQVGPHTLPQTHSARHRKKKAVHERQYAASRRPSALYRLSNIAFICPVCARMHIDRPSAPPDSYLLVSEHPQAAETRLFVAAEYRLLPDARYDRVVDPLIGVGDQKIVAALPEFQKRLTELSFAVWFSTDRKQAKVQWEPGWWSEYQCE